MGGGRSPQTGGHPLGVIAADDDSATVNPQCWFPNLFLLGFVLLESVPEAENDGRPL